MFDLSYDDKEIQRLVFHKYSVLVIKHAAISIWRGNNAQKRSGNIIDYDIEWMGEDDIYPSDNVIFDGKGHSCIIQTEWLYDAMLRLDDKYKSVLILKYWYGFLQKEIAEMLQVSRRTITSWKSRAFKSIKDYRERIGNCDVRQS